MTIWKFPLRITDEVVLDMPEGAKVLCVQVVEEPVIYALVDEDAPIKSKRFKILGTGHRHPEIDRDFYVGTIRYKGGVWHVFEETNY